MWRVVSSDSHPIEGTFSFTATAAAAGATAAAAVPTLGTAQPGTTQAPAPAPDASEPFPWSMVVFAAVALGLLVALGVLAKRRLSPAPAATRLNSDAESLAPLQDRGWTAACPAGPAALGLGRGSARAKLPVRTAGRLSG